MLLAGLAYQLLIRHEFWFGKRQTLRLPQTGLSCLHWMREKLCPILAQPTIFQRSPAEHESTFEEFLRRIFLQFQHAINCRQAAQAGLEGR